jgi:acyl-CoA synthetase (AMP-forming)/AMP-acid ligase II
MKINFSTASERLAEAFGSREAVVNVERNRRYTFREYHELTNRICNMLHQRLEIGKGDFYLCILDNDSMSLFSHLTVFKGHGSAAYTNYRDSVDEHAWQIDHVHPKVVITEAELLDSHYAMLHEKGVPIVCMDPPGEAFADKPEVLHFWDLLDGISDKNPDVEHDDREDTMLLRFTGGTTGKGKCAAYTIDNWLMCRDSFYSLPEPLWHPDVRFLHVAPLSHGSSMPVLATMFRGGCTVTMNMPDLAQYCRNIENERITAAFLVPTILYRLLEVPEASDADLSSLDTVYYGAAPMSPAKLKLLQEKFGNIFVQIYGATENACVSTSLPKYAHRIESAEDETRLSSAGQAVPGVELIVADDDGNALPQGEIGEICLRSRAICQGYFGNPEGTAKEFRDGFWKSADMGYIDENGFVYIVDRKKDMIISGGFNIYAIEVESAINTHEAVLMSAVVGIPHDEWGEAVHAEVVLRERESVDANELIAFAKEQLGRFKAPKTIAFVDELPLTAVGKVLRRKVRDKYWEAAGRKVS